MTEGQMLLACIDDQRRVVHDAAVWFFFRFALATCDATLRGIPRGFMKVAVLVVVFQQIYFEADALEHVAERVVAIEHLVIICAWTWTSRANKFVVVRIGMILIRYRDPQVAAR